MGRILTLCTGRASHLAVLLLALATISGAGGSARAEEPARFSIVPRFDVRVRQEILRNVYWFDPAENDRNWIRYRTRAGFVLSAGDETSLSFRLANECRTRLEPDRAFDDDEIVVERLAFEWRAARAGGLHLAIGRQDIPWNDGFLLFDGTPLDGSRTAHHDAVRLRLPARGGMWDAALVLNEKTDPIVPASGDERALRDADERAIAVRFVAPGDWERAASGAGWEAALIGIGEKDPDGSRPDYTGWTAAVRRETRAAGLRRSVVEVAGQRQASAGETGYALAANAARARRIGERAAGEIGFFYYSGDGENTRAFRSPFGRWPKWSEMWVYSLIGEGGPGQWQNLASPYVSLRVAPLGGDPILARLALHGSVLVPYAPEPTWEDRGLLAKLELQARVRPGVAAHLLWEWHTSATYPEAQTENAHFVRWQISYERPSRP